MVGVGIGGLMPKPMLGFIVRLVKLRLDSSSSLCSIAAPVMAQAQL